MPGKRELPTRRCFRASRAGCLGLTPGTRPADWLTGCRPSMRWRKLPQRVALAASTTPMPRHSSTSCARRSTKWTTTCSWPSWRLQPRAGLHEGHAGRPVARARAAGQQAHSFTSDLRRAVDRPHRFDALVHWAAKHHWHVAVSNRPPACNGASVAAILRSRGRRQPVAQSADRRARPGTSVV
jgi:hypothetical protein